MALLNCHDIKRTQEILGHGRKNTVKIPVVMLRYLHPDVERSTPNSPRSLAVRKNPGQTIGMSAPDAIYEQLKSGSVDMIPVPGHRNRVWVYSKRRDDVVEVSEDRARTWLALGKTMRDQRTSVQAALRERYGRSAPPAVEVMPEPSMLVPVSEPLSLFASEPVAAPKRTRKKAKENPMRDDDWYWKAIYSNVPPGPSRAHPVAQRNPRYEVIESRRWVNEKTGKTASIYGAVPWTRAAEKREWSIETVGWTILDNRTGTVGIGRHPFKTKKEAQDWADEWNEKMASRSKSNPSEIHYTSKGQPYEYMNGRPRFVKKSAARRNPAGAHGAFEQMIEPFGVMQQRFDGEQPIPRRNPKKKKASAKKNNHRVWEQIIDPFSVTEARTYGRQPIGRRNPAGAHGAFAQIIGPFSVSEEELGGRQPIPRRNPKKKKAKKNGVVRVYKVK
jgi:hypothetical protein